MVLDLGGVATNMPLYDQQGNLLQPNDSFMYPHNDTDEDLDVIQSQMILEVVADVINKIGNSKTNLSLSPDVDVFDYDWEEGTNPFYYALSLHGGLNGRGQWSDYLSTLLKMFSELESIFEDVWIVNFNVDCSDDVFDIDIGILPHKLM